MFTRSLLIVSVLAASGIAAPGDSAEVKKLLARRVEVLKKAVEAVQARAMAGRASPSDLARVGIDLAEAELELADTAEKRREIRLRIFKFAVEIDEEAFVRVEAASATMEMHYQARAFRLKAEIELRRAGGAPPKDTKPPREPKGPKDD